MTWRETNTVRDFRTFRNGIYVITTFHSLHDELHNVIVEGEDTVTRQYVMSDKDIKRHYGIEL